MANNADRPGVDVHAAVEVFHRQPDRVAAANDSRGADENIDSWKVMYFILNYLNIFIWQYQIDFFMNDSYNTVMAQNEL